VQNEHVTS